MCIPKGGLYVNVKLHFFPFISVGSKTLESSLFFRYTIVMIYYAFNLLIMMITRPVLSKQFLHGRGCKSIYAALYFLPILVVFQSVFAGLLCKYLKYIIIVKCQWGRFSSNFPGTHGTTIFPTCATYQLTVLKDAILSSGVDIV